MARKNVSPVSMQNQELSEVLDPTGPQNPINRQYFKNKTGNLEVHAWILYNNTTGVHNVIKSFNITSSQRLSLGKTEIVYPDIGSTNFLVSSNVVSPDTGTPVQLNELRGQRTSTSAVFQTNDTGSSPNPDDEGRTTVIIYKDVN